MDQDQTQLLHAVLARSDGRAAGRISERHGSRQGEGLLPQRVLLTGAERSITGRAAGNASLRHATKETEAEGPISRRNSCTKAKVVLLQPEHGHGIQELPGNSPFACVDRLNLPTIVLQPETPKNVKAVHFICAMIIQPRVGVVAARVSF